MTIRSRHSRVLPASAMVVIGGSFVVLGGLVAAVTGPVGLERGSWLAAYLVLVCGVAQFAIGTVQSGQDLGTKPMPWARGWVQLTCLNLGSVAVIVGTLAREPSLVDSAVGLLLVAFGIALHTVRPWASQPMRGLVELQGRGSVGRLVLWGYRVFLLLLVVSLPVGSVLAHLRSN